MKFETLKWIYQRASTLFIFILSFWLFYEAYQIKDYNYENIHIFFKSYTNLFLFIIFIILSTLHTSIEVFHSIDDYFSKTKNENMFRIIIKLLYTIVFLAILIFLIKFIFIQ